MPKHVICPKEAAKAVAGTPLMIMLWDIEWTQWAVFPPTGCQLTPQNVRGIVRRNLRKARYEVDMIERELPSPFENCDTGCSFRFKPLPLDRWPKQKVEARPFVPLQPAEEKRKQAILLQEAE